MMLESPSPFDRIQSNWQRTVEKVADACMRSNREMGSVTIVGVTKYVDAVLTKHLYDAGCCDLGESRPQNIWSKAPALPDAQWHLIGHLQRNKVKRTLPLVELIHSVDSLRLLEQIAIDAESLSKRTRLLIEVNVTQDASKTGASPDEAMAILDRGLALPHLEIVGVMAMASLQGTSDQARAEFASVRVLRDQLAERNQHPLPVLSMGMSGDFVEAIAEGATLIRLGSCLFEGLLT
ncbi:MAG: YggS family pyridoxal phosphate-dependent enzyme [Pirellulales bacterium]